MKIVPILAISNALALGLVILLFVQQSDLKSQLGSSRSASRSGAAGIDVASMEQRILERLRDERGAAAPVSVETAGEARVDDPTGTGEMTASRGSDGAPTGTEGGDKDAGVLQGPRMEVFRRNVRKANELNRQEDRVNGEIERLDRLVENGRIAALNEKQKSEIANKVLGFRQSSREIWGQLRSNPQLREMAREDRMKYVREEFAAMRDRAAKELEKIVPPADAKTISETAMRGGWGGFRGDGGRTRGPGRNRNADGGR